MHFEDRESGIAGYGFLSTAEQQADRDLVFIMELESQGYTLADVLQTRSKKPYVNWRHGDPGKYVETHWQIFEPGYASEEDENTTQETLRKFMRIAKLMKVYGV